MTTPQERTTAVLDAREFLVRLASEEHAEDVRAKAAELLRHYPRFEDLMEPGSFDTEVAMRHGMKAFARKAMDGRRKTSS